MLNVLVIYDLFWYKVCSVKDYIDSFSLYSKFNIFYLQAGTLLNCKIDNFQIIVIHWSICIDNQNIYEQQIRSILNNFSGLKVLFTQDEYQMTGVKKAWIKHNGIHVIFTVVPSEYIIKVFGEEIANERTIRSVLTGYVPIRQAMLSNYIKPLKYRKNLIAYRGRDIGYFYGNLGREKFIIGKSVKEFTDKNNIASDIEVEESKRIYGDEWYGFLCNSIATLGTESGSNVFCFYGEVRQAVSEYLSKNPDSKFENVHADVLSKIESRICKMNQISPKIFESISLKVCLVLFEGEYSGILIPNKHYFPLKKDFSNLPDVFDFLSDYGKLTQMIECTYKDIVLSGKYSYKTFIHKFDELLSSFFIISNCSALK